MPKKPPPNGYYFFMKDWKAREERFGRRFPNGMKDVAIHASEDWKNLPPQEKERYNKIAKDHRHDPRPNVPKAEEKRYNSFGVSFAELERQRQEKDARIKQSKDFLFNLVNSMTIDDLKEHPFYLIHVNYFCKTDHDEYLPAEIAISEFSLLNGVHKYFHRFLSPGTIPTGYACEVKEHSDKYHRIPFNLTRNMDKFDEVYAQLREFMKGKFVTFDNPPLFTLTDNVFDNTSTSAVKKTLERLWESAHYGPDTYDTWESEFGVYSLAQLLFEMKRKILDGNPNGILPFPNDVLADAELRKDLYHFRSEMACKFHQVEDNLAFCSQSYVIRWAHIIRDHCCHYLGIDTAALPKTYVCDANDLGDLVEDMSLRDDDFNDAKSTLSGYTTVSYATERSVGFSSVKSVKTDTSSPGSLAPSSTLSTATSWASAISQPKPPSSVASSSWATASQPKKAPTFDNKNFPSLGCGRGRVPLQKRNPSTK
ncbi:protein maelstrom homolog [Planococcus citri]|uniref:protein maelstrom homolog n=1 Tax=Planococcus citri TaxID=170843 RepID=UPI0031F8429D